MTIKEKEQNYIDEFSVFDEWLDKYQYIIDLAKDLEPISDAEKTEENKVHGCQSNVWLVVEQTPDGRLVFRADSDALITKGIISLLVGVYSGAKPEEILESDFSFLDEIGLTSNLSATRRSGLASMVEKIKMYAAKYN